MGDITDKIFEGIGKTRERKNLERQNKIVQREQELDERKRTFVEKASLADGAVLQGTTDKAVLETRLRSFLDTRRVGNAAAGENAANTEDAILRQLSAEEGHYQRGWGSLKSQAIAAQGRLLGIAPRAGGYDSPAPSGSSKGVGPILLTLGVGIIEWLQTANWFSHNLSLWQSSIGGTTKAIVTLVGSGLLTSIVMATTFLAGRKLKEGMIARRASKAEAANSGTGGELGQGVGMVLVAALFQTVTLALRFSTDSGDKGAQNGAIVIGLISFCGALVVLLWEYSSFNAAASTGKAVYTRQADADKIDEFRRAEYQRSTGMPLVKRDLQIAALRLDEDGLTKLQAAALEAGPVQMGVLNSLLDGIRNDIRMLQEKSFEYEPFDLDAAAVRTFGAQEKG